MGMYDDEWWVSGIVLGIPTGLISVLIKSSPKPYSFIPFIGDSGGFTVNLYEVGIIIILISSYILAIRLRSKILDSYDNFITGLIAWQKEIVSYDILWGAFGFIGSILGINVLNWIFFGPHSSPLEISSYIAQLIILLCIATMIFGLGKTWEYSIPENKSQQYEPSFYNYSPVKQKETSYSKPLHTKPFESTVNNRDDSEELKKNNESNNMYYFEIHSDSKTSIIIKPDLETYECDFEIINKGNVDDSYTIKACVKSLSFGKVQEDITDLWPDLVLGRNGLGSIKDKWMGGVVDIPKVGSNTSVKITVTFKTHSLNPDIEYGDYILFLEAVSQGNPKITAKDSYDIIYKKPIKDISIKSIKETEKVDLDHFEENDVFSKTSLSSITQFASRFSDGDYIDIIELKECKDLASVVIPTNPIILSEKLKEAYKKAGILAKPDISIYIHGERGTGKEELAKFIHSKSYRANSPFEAENCAALNGPLFDSAFFGHVKGAFNNAIQDRCGLLEKANNGTLFLDEIGELNLENQAKLLRVLQEGEYRPVGSDVIKTVDIRFICATNRDLDEMVELGTFRDDLYDRLAKQKIVLPKLKGRTQDIRALLKRFILLFAQKQNKNIIGYSKGVRKCFEQYSWSGNIRKLMSIVEGAVSFCEGDYILLKNIKGDVSVKTFIELSETDRIIKLKNQCKKHFEQTGKKPYMQTIANHFEVNRKTIYRLITNHPELKEHFSSSD